MSTAMPAPVDDEALSLPPAASPRGSGDAAAGRALLGTSDVRRFLVDFAKRRVQPSDVDDVVQTILCDALASDRIPSEGSELRRWLVGIARHKVADVHRKAKREPPVELPEIEANPAPIEEREMATWAERQVGSTREAKQTLDWMAREGEGEKLESIATEEKVPAARVRQRVSRLRRWMKERWLAELAAVAVLGVLALAAWWILRRPEAMPDAVIVPEVPTATPEPAPTTPPAPPDDALARAKVTRRAALERCDEGQWDECLRGLDDAKVLDPAGEAAPEVQNARDAAAKALAPPPPEEPKKKSNATPGPAPTTPVKPTTTTKAMPKASKRVLSSDDWDMKK